MSDVKGTAGDSSGAVMDRRALLRAGGVAAGIAGIGGLAAAEAPAAGAAAGDPVIMGAVNDAGSSSTLLRSNEYVPTMILANSGPSGVPLRLQERTSADFATTDSGDLMNFDGDLRFSHGDSMLASVFTSSNATRLAPVRPFRFIDTRTESGRTNILAPPSYFDSAGRLIGGRDVEIELSEAVYLASAVFMNLTVVQPVADGYLTVWPDGTRLGTSTLNYRAGQTVANFCISALGPTDTVRLYASRTTHVLMDLVAFAVPGPTYINRAMLAATGAASLAGPARTPPAWHASQNG